MTVGKFQMETSAKWRERERESAGEGEEGGRTEERIKKKMI